MDIFDGVRGNVQKYLDRKNGTPMTDAEDAGARQMLNLPGNAISLTAYDRRSIQGLAISARRKMILHARSLI